MLQCGPGRYTLFSEPVANIWGHFCHSKNICIWESRRWERELCLTVTWKTLLMFPIIQVPTDKEDLESKAGAVQDKVPVN